MPSFGMEQVADRAGVDEEYVRQLIECRRS